MYKKKPVKKKALGGILLGQLAKKNDMDLSTGLLPGLAKKAGVKIPGMMGLAGLATGKKMAKGGRVRGDGCAVRGKTKGTIR